MKCPFPVSFFEWDPERNIIQEGAVENVDVIIHLAGESVAAGRWTQERKDKILKSRQQGTSLLIKAIKNSIKNGHQKPKKFISASAIGIYGDRGDETLTEETQSSTGFLAEVCQTWEKLAREVEELQIPWAIVRIGIVLGLEGGALKSMLPPFYAGVGGKLGSGEQYMSWIHLDDLVSLFLYLIENEKSKGIYNGVAPHPVRNTEFTKILGKEISRPTLFPVPAWILKTVVGQMSDILLHSQKVLPERALREGFNFAYPELGMALHHILQDKISGERRLKKYQWVKKSPAQVFPFFADEKNLEKITPEFLRFYVEGKNTEEICPGTSIDYSLKLRGIPIHWQSLITSYEREKYFVDTQTKGPFEKWVHTHKFIPLFGGTLLEDEIVYKIPLGHVGDILAGRFVQSDLKKIFNYRCEKIKQMIA